jgi:enediyne biosynthesis protein CalE5
MPVTAFDPVAFKAEQRASWDVISDGWDAWRDSYERAAQPVTRHLLAAAGLRPGHRVLDVGSGTGEPALSAAAAVAPTGSVLGIDLSPRMVARATLRATTGNVRFVAGDVEDLDLPRSSREAVLSRWGLMFAVDRQRTLRALRRLLVPGGILSAAVWGPPGDNAMTSLGFRALTDGLGLPAPDPERPGPFTMTDPARISAVLADAGFADISVTAVPVCLRLASAADFVAYTRAVTPPPVLAAVRSRPDDEAAAWRRVAAAATPYATTDGQIALPGLALCLRAVAPGPAADG